MRARHVRAFRGITLPLLTAVLLVARGVSSVDAHATIVTSSIKPGAVLTRTPRTLRATFAEGVAPSGSFLRIFEGSGDHGEVDLGNSAVSFHDVKEMTVGLPARLARGTYLVLWYTVSADDGHIAGGSFSFTVA